MRTDSLDQKAFTFKLRGGRVANKLGRNIKVYSNGVLFIEDGMFVPREEILEIEERDTADVAVLTK